MIRVITKCFIKNYTILIKYSQQNKKMTSKKHKIMCLLQQCYEYS